MCECYVGNTEICGKDHAAGNYGASTVGKLQLRNAAENLLNDAFSGEFATEPVAVNESFTNRRPRVLKSGIQCL